jgi:hypothetical protein|tara:strand:- start:312 stop:491 length:180 start_codon:yes stop_codon:yes gene_type:complete
MTDLAKDYDSIEIRKAKNGFILLISDPDGDSQEYVYDTSRKLMRVLKATLENKNQSNED